MPPDRPLKLSQVISTLHVHKDVEALAQGVAHRVAALIVHTLAARNVCRLALAGGETPNACYAVLSGLEVDWARVQIYFGDERCLPVHHAQRNDAMAQQFLLKKVTIPAENVHAIQAELGAQQGAANYLAQLQAALPLDIVLLGMGEDGHTASLFPNHPALHTTDAVVAVFDAPKYPQERVSLSLDTLNSARHKIVLVTGKGKQNVLARIADGDPLPVAQITDAEWNVTQDVMPAI